ncbi:hypothetical protein L596_026057 [Steinernema carpocapsae]|uniref:Uncharacterized protein n=1 Tax=Steinernema carpocapsae TaxID=34508 RepID=A0A4V5ZY24_STECR|nr:hypothetical protein L596_026057 [Steinernema carpocapsae]
MDARDVYGYVAGCTYISIAVVTLPFYIFIIRGVISLGNASLNACYPTILLLAFNRFVVIAELKLFGAKFYKSCFGILAIYWLAFFCFCLTQWVGIYVPGYSIASLDSLTQQMSLARALQLFEKYINFTCLSGTFVIYVLIVIILIYRRRYMTSNQRIMTTRELRVLIQAVVIFVTCTVNLLWSYYGLAFTSNYMQSYNSCLFTMLFCQLTFGTMNIVLYLVLNSFQGVISLGNASGNVSYPIILLLAFSRFVIIAELKLFGAKFYKFCFGVLAIYWLAFFCFCLTPWVGTMYVPGYNLIDGYSKTQSLSLTKGLNRFEEYVNFSCIGGAFIAYVLTVLILIYRRRRMTSNQSVMTPRELKVLIQAVVIFVGCTLNSVWGFYGLRFSSDFMQSYIIALISMLFFQVNFGTMNIVLYLVVNK